MSEQAIKHLEIHAECVGEQLRLMEELAKIRRDNAALLAATKNQKAWIERHLQTLVHVDVVGGNYGRDVVNGFAAAQIPDWDMRQKLESLNEDIKQAES